MNILKTASQALFNKMQTKKIGGREHLHFKCQLFYNPFGSKMLLKNKWIKEKGLEATVLFFFNSAQVGVKCRTQQRGFHFFLDTYSVAVCVWPEIRRVWWAVALLLRAAFARASGCHFCPLGRPSFKGWMLAGNLNVQLAQWWWPHRAATKSPKSDSWWNNTFLLQPVAVLHSDLWCLS